MLYLHTYVHTQTDTHTRVCGCMWYRLYSRAEHGLKENIKHGLKENIKHPIFFYELFNR